MKKYVSLANFICISSLFKDTLYHCLIFHTVLVSQLSIPQMKTQIERTLKWLAPIAADTTKYVTHFPVCSSAVVPPLTSESIDHNSINEHK